MPETSPPLRLKLLFWLILSALSVLLAEVVSFNIPSPLAFPTVLALIFVMIPLSGLSLIILSNLVFKYNVSIPALFLAGTLLGMYEAYLMKQFWSPTWGLEWTLMFGGVSWMHVMTLIGYWHPVMACILPVFIAETFFTTSSETIQSLPKWAQKLLTSRIGAHIAIIAIVIYMGARIGMGTRNLPLALWSQFQVIGVFAGLALIWRRVIRERRYTFRELMPSPRQNRLLIAALLILYIVHTFLVRFDALPLTLTPHLTVWALYAVLIGLLILHLRRPRRAAHDADGIATMRPVWWLGMSVLIGLVTSGYIRLKTNSSSFDYYGWKTLWYGEWAIGAALIVWTIASLFIPIQVENCKERQVVIEGDSNAKR